MTWSQNLPAPSNRWHGHSPLLRRLVCVVVTIATAGACAGSVRAAEPSFTAEQLQFFEKQVRPILVEHCNECHSSKAKIVQGALRLDGREHALRGGESGPAVVPGKPAESLLIDAVQWKSFEMPPAGRLPAEKIAVLTKWVEQGAPWPAEMTAASAPTFEEDWARRSQHWSYQPVHKPASPVVKNKKWPNGEIDRLILAKLEAAGLQPAAPADKQTLVRRVYFDLIGLPPTPAEIAQFVADDRPDAYEQLVDQLLASPRYGERWGRHWLDVARYAESLTLRGFVLKETWRYRDYVIDCFNQDVPFDRFIREQIAGDLLPAEGLEATRRQRIATSFLVMGNYNLEEQDKKQLRMDVVDEQLDTLSRAFLAQTVTCARCHDHKFDPIPTRDYYALAGILRNAKSLEHSNVSKWLDVPLPADPAREAIYAAQEAAEAALKAQIQTLKSAIAKAKKPDNPNKPAVVKVDQVAGIVIDDLQAKKVGKWTTSKYSSTYVGEGYLHDDGQSKGEATLTFQPELPQAGKYEVRLAYNVGANRSTNVPVTIFSADGEKTVHVNQREVPDVDGLFHSLGTYSFEKNGQGFVIVANEETKGHVIADAVAFVLVDKVADSTADVGTKPTTSKGVPPVELAAVTPPTITEFDPDQLARDKADLKKLEEQLKKLAAEGPRRDMAMSVEEEKKIEETHIHIRGSVHKQGEVAPRGFLQVATHEAVPEFPANESGRRQLADWLASPKNPLTARVQANRAWNWLFGVGLVRTTENFGLTGELPSHPELLDYLAAQFMAEGWSTKRLVRQIVLSQTYRQAVTASAAASSVDPENRLCSHANRRRLDAESIRDTMLQVSGQLQLEMNGPTYKPNVAADYNYKHTDTRRSVYTPVFRNSLPELFEVFDFADPSVSTGRRNVSTVAPQALFMMNSPFVLQQASVAAEKLTQDANLDEAAKITQAYRLTLGRSPTAAERTLIENFVADAGTDAKAKQAAWTQVFQTLFASVDFRYLN